MIILFDYSDYAGSIVSSSICSKLSSLPATADYDTDTLRKELTTHGYNPGPITFTTKKVYLRKLKQIIKHPPNPTQIQTTRKGISIYYFNFDIFHISSFYLLCFL